ncbi:MAG: hypothetical protein NVS4B12_15940 [Ktedonobacteraceae bacterium]
MAGWEEELALLLRELGVKQEEPDVHSRPMTTPSQKSTRKPTPSDVSKRGDVKQREQFADALFWGAGNATSGDVADDKNDPWTNDLGLMRREVDSIVRQVVRLMQRGDMEPSLKEDVMVVLRALRRRAMVTQLAAATDEAYLESASAMLHFCRLVLQISEDTTEDL